MHFSYKAHYDDGGDDDDDSVHMPQQSYRDAGAAGATGAKALGRPDIYDSTEIDDDDDDGSGPNPLYSAHMHLAFGPELSVNTEYFADSRPRGGDADVLA